MEAKTKISVLKKLIAQVTACIDTDSVDQIGRAILTGIEETADEFDWRDLMKESNPELYRTFKVAELLFKESE